MEFKNAPAEINIEEGKRQQDYIMRLKELVAKYKLKNIEQPYYQKGFANDNESIISLGSGFGKY